MEYEAKDEELIRKYLIGELAEGELRTVEERIMTDKEFSDLALFVEDKMIEDYIEDRLDSPDRENFENLFLATRQGAEQVRFTRELKERAAKANATKADETEQLDKFEPRSRRSIFRERFWAFAAAAIILIAAGVGIWNIIPPRSEIDQGNIALNKAYKNQRPVEARLTVLQYATRPKTRGGDDGKVDRSALRLAELKFESEAENRPGAESFHAFGRYYLTQRNFDQAIDLLQKALGFAPEDAQIYSDLGAAYLEKGKADNKKQSGEEAEDFSKSLEYLTKAINLNPNLLEARFNRALLYEQLSDTSQAIDDWQEYLKRDSRSPWADEAREKIAAPQLR
jgi:tetratricopeptide (TPR) repeat protein